MDPTVVAVKPSVHPRPFSGEQHEITFGDQVATAVEVGGGLRSYRLRGRDILDGYGVDEICPGAAGQILAPWPNRIEDGAYHFAGERHRLPLSEPEARNAIHGLARWISWHKRESSASHVVLGCLLNPRPGYPFPLELSVRYELHAAGLTVTHLARNVGPRPCPFGLGFHPYFFSTSGSVDQLTLTLPADLVDDVDVRNLPLGTVAVEHLNLDFRHGALIGARRIDNCFSGLSANADGRVLVLIDDITGGRTTLWLERAFQHVQVFTGDTLSGARRRRALSVEPLTCAANAFRTHRDLIVLLPGDSFTASWGIEPSGVRPD